MHLFEELGPEIRHEFASKRAELPLAYFYGPDAAEKLARGLVEELSAKSVLVFSDARTRVAGSACLTALERAGLQVLEQSICDSPGGKGPVCDDLTKNRLGSGLPRADCYVAVGSGVVNDLTKWLAGELGVPYAVFATAASMNGYTAANVAPSVNGVKSLFRARAPRIIAADPQVVANAPFALTSSGLGDVIAKPVSTADWWLNHRLFNEPYSEAIAGVINQVEPRYLDAPEAIARREGPAVQALFDALILSGCAMTLQGSSLPASGGEHLISHALDMLAQVDGVEHDLHGRQVGVATIIAAALYEEVLALGSPRFDRGVVPFDQKLWKTIADAVQVEHQKKGQRMAEACRALSEPGRWASLRGQLAALTRPAASVKACLKAAGGAHRFSDLGCSRERFLTALLNGAAIRGRFTSLDLAWATGVLPGAAERLVDRWVTA
jgi:glycerol-1-phosphate dehydrogenase [NAD(P)+]